MPKKWIHKDGSETILKVKHYKRDENTLERIEVKRDFVTLFVSSSVGCRIGCKMCFLTHSDIKYRMLSPLDIMNNNLLILEKYSLPYNNIKISFMGMGEGIYNYHCLNKIAEEIAGDKLCAVDIGTMLPFVSDELLFNINNLYNGRFFYSLHSAIQNTRDKLISSKVTIDQAKNFLQDINIKKVCHYTVIGDINDSDVEIRKAIKYCADVNAQLRIVEFNQIGDLQKSDKVQRICEILRNECNNYKLCYSSGKGLKMSCGMFF